MGKEMRELEVDLRMTNFPAPHWENEWQTKIHTKYTMDNFFTYMYVNLFTNNNRGTLLRFFIVRIEKIFEERATCWGSSLASCHTKGPKVCDKTRDIYYVSYNCVTNVFFRHNLTFRWEKRPNISRILSPKTSISKRQHTARIVQLTNPCIQCFFYTREWQNRQRAPVSRAK